MKKNEITWITMLTGGWTTLKFIRVGLGTLILYSSIGSGEVAGMILGGLFTLVSLFSAGVCCAGASCYTPAVRKNNSQQIEKIEYEELGSE